MDPGTRLFLTAAAERLPEVGDHVVRLVGRAVMDPPPRGDAGQWLDAMVDEGALTPEAALYLAGLRQVLQGLGDLVTA